MNKYDAKLAQMDSESAKKFGKHINAGMGQKPPKKKTTKKTSKK